MVRTTHARFAVPVGTILTVSSRTARDHVFKTNRESFNLQAIKQDHMCEEINLPQMSSTVNVARDWLAGMGQGAEQQNFSIQYCMHFVRLPPKLPWLPLSST